MKHHSKTKRLSRDCSHRKSLVKNLARSLFIHNRIVTSYAKSCILIPYVSRFITTLMSKNNNLNAMRYIKSKINNEDKVSIKKIMLFYIANLENTKSNYISKKTVFNTRSDSMKTVLIRLI